jgi:hypothetical protein
VHNLEGGVGHRADAVDRHVLDPVDAVSLSGTPGTSITQWSPSQIAVAVYSAIRPPGPAISEMSPRLGIRR